MLSLLLFIVIPYVCYWVKKWHTRRTPRMATLPAVTYQVMEPTEAEASQQQQKQPELPGAAQQLAIEPALTNMPLELQIIYDLLV